MPPLNDPPRLPAPGDPIDLVHGSRAYGGRGSQIDQLYGPDALDTQKQWYQPALSLGGRSVICLADVPTLLSPANSGRKFFQCRNLGAVDVLVGGAKNVNNIAGDPNAGWPVHPDEGLPFDAHEIVGEIWGIATADCDVRVFDPTVGQ